MLLDWVMLQLSAMYFHERPNFNWVLYLSSNKSCFKAKVLLHWLSSLRVWRHSKIVVYEMWKLKVLNFLHFLDLCLNFSVIKVRQCLQWSSGVKFANILRAAFSYESYMLFCSWSLTSYLFWHKKIGGKPDHNLLVKLTPDFDLTFESCPGRDLFIDKQTSYLRVKP